MRIRASLFPLLLLAASAAAQTAAPRDPLPVPDVAGYKTLKCDFHMHTVFSDGQVWPVVRLTEAFRDGLDVVALTDHAGYSPHQDDVKADNARPHALARETARQLGIVLVPGIEVNDGDLHFNALFVTDANALRGVPLKEALTRAKAQGGFAFWNHPGWKEKARWFPPVAELFDAQLFRGMELVNGPRFYDEVYPWVAERPLTILCNSDVHGLITDGYERRNRPVTLVFAKTRDLEGIREALVERRSAAWMNGEVWGAEEHLKGLWEGAIRAQQIKGGAVLLRNSSALPFQIKVDRAARAVTVKPETTTGLAMPKAGPELAVEVTNFHIAPGRNLTLTVRLEPVP